MKTGMSLEELAEKVDEQNETKRDFIINTKDMKLDLSMTDPSKLWLQFKDRQRKRVREYRLRLTPHTVTQISKHTSVPMRLIESMLNGTRKEAEQILKLISTRLKENPMHRMVRVLPNFETNYEYVRAFLSDRYRVIDNHEVMQALFPLMQEFKGRLVVESCHVGEKRFYIKLKFTDIEGSLGSVWKNGTYIDDVVQAGVMISNSEVGDGPIRIQPFILRLVCFNGATMTTYLSGSRKIHVGRKMLRTADILEDNQVLSNEAYFEKVIGTIRELLSNKSLYRDMFRQFKAAKKFEINDPEAAVKVLGQQFKLTQQEEGLILFTLNNGAARSTKTLTRFHLINAVTRVSKSASLAYSRATSLERIGGILIEMDDRTWKKIGSAKTPKGDK